jgi:multiple sugar transport system permease protein
VDVPLARPLASAVRRRRLSPRGRKRGSSFLITLIAVCALAAFLSPLARSVAISFKNRDQITQTGAPLYPADPVTFDYQGRTYDVYEVPIDGTMRELALVTPGRRSSEFVDPANPDAGLIAWEGSFRSLQRAWKFAAHPENYARVWDLLDYPRLLFNTAFIAVVGMIGVLV